MSELSRIIGIAGDGQLGRMLVQDGLKMEQDFEFRALGTSGPDSPAALAGAVQVNGAITNPAALRKLAEQSEIVTIEIEHVNAGVLARLQREGHNIQPSPLSLQTIQNKLMQKHRLARQDIAVADFAALSDVSDYDSVRRAFGDSFMAKAATGGYDGRGNLPITADMNWQDLQDGLRDKKTGELPVLYAEKLIDFECELAVIGARGVHDQVAVYAPFETKHSNSICQIVKTPANIDSEISQRAIDLYRRTLDCFKGLGILTVEMFHERSTGKLYVNEVAPRVHNSGHITINSHETSQFTQHLLAITGQQLGSTTLRDGVMAGVMVNILGVHDAILTEELRALEGDGIHTFVNWYDKAPRSEPRKIGHVNALGSTTLEALSRATPILGKIQDPYLDLEALAV